MSFALAMPPVELTVSSIGSGTRAPIDGMWPGFATRVNLSDPWAQVEQSGGDAWLVFDVCLRLGHEDLSTRLPEITRVGSRTLARLGPRAPLYSVLLRVTGRADDAVRVGPVGAPVDALQPASVFGTRVGGMIRAGGELHHRVAVRVDRAQQSGGLDFPLVYRVEAEDQLRPAFTTKRRWR